MDRYRIKLSKWNSLSVFMLCIVVATIGILPLIVANNGLAYWIADFNSQQVPFYIYCSEHIKNGAGFWSWKTDLGSDFITSYSFYTLGSPFFWLIMLFPTSWIKYLLFPLMILKMGIAGVTSYLYLQQYVKNKSCAVLGALVYTFSGYTINTLFYNHFLDIIALFPLLPYTLDICVHKKAKGKFALAVALCALTNYVFFVGEVVFLVLYFTSKLIAKEYKIDCKCFFRLAFESVIGFCISLPIVLPSVLELANNSRATTRFNSLKEALCFTLGQYFLLLKAFILPADVQNLECLLEPRYTCTEAYLPFVGLTFVIAFFMAKCHKVKFAKILLAICTIFSLVPLLNSSFNLFNSAYYTRWFYMFILVIALGSIKIIDEDNSFILIQIASIISFMVTICFCLVTITINNYNKNVINNSYFYVLAVVASLGPILTFFVEKYTERHRRNLYLGITICYCMLCLIMNSIYSKPVGAKEYYESFINYDADLPKEEFYRIEHQGYSNLALVSDYYDIWNWNSTVNDSITEFYEGIGYTRYVASFPGDELYGIRSLLSIKYRLGTVPTNGLYQQFETKTTQVYENMQYIPMGYTFDYYISESTYNQIPIEKRHLALIKSLVLDSSNILEHQDLLHEITNPDDALNFDYSTEIENRNKYVCSDFQVTSKGFQGTIDLPEEKIVFFSVPYAKGWNAEINGTKVPIIKVDKGLMAVRCVSGTNNIYFTYRTYGYEYGCAISICALLLLISYMFINIYQKRKETLL